MSLGPLVESDFLLEHDAGRARRQHLGAERQRAEHMAVGREQAVGDEEAGADVLAVLAFRRGRSTATAARPRAERAPQVLQLLRIKIVSGLVGKIVELAVSREHHRPQQPHDDLQRRELFARSAISPLCSLSSADCASGSLSGMFAGPMIARTLATASAT